MTAKPETAAEVLAEMREMSNTGFGIFGADLRNFADRIERAHANELASLLPGPEYMDPPDGGDVPLLEQCRRMSEDAAKWRTMSAQSPSYDALLLIAQSVCGALNRAGVTDCDDPGEAIDVLRERWERALSAQGEAVAWIRFYADGSGCYEGPIHNSQMDDVRRKSGKWLPLYTHPAPARVTEEMVERAAAGIHEFRRAYTCRGSLDEQDDGYQARVRGQARAALTAALEADHG